MSASLVGSEMCIRDSLLHPLMLKAVLYGREPLPWVGGLLHPVHKGAEAADLPKAYRAVVLADGAGKIHHK
eukprot:6853411-Alexandrium_andersonii.AAC.1